MAGIVIISQAPNQHAEAHLEGHRLITPTPLAGLTWGRFPCTFHDLCSETASQSLISDAQAIALLGELLATDARCPWPADQALLDSIRTLVGAGSTEALTSHSGRHGPLLNLAAAYTQALHAKGLVDTALPQDRTVDQQRLLVHGYTNFNAAQAHFLTQVADDQSIILLPERDHETSKALAQMFETLGWEVRRCADARPPTESAVLHAADRLHEARAALRAAGEHYANVPQGRIIITARIPEDYRTVLTLAAREQGLPLHFYGTRSYAQTPGGQLLLLVAQVLLGDWAYEDVCALLASPQLPELTARHWSRIRQAGAHRQTAWKATGLLPTELRFMTAFPKEGSAHEWFESLQPLPQASNLLFEILPTLTRLLPNGGDQQAFGAALHQALRLPSQESGGIPENTILVIPPEMVCGARADLIVTLGLNEGIWPAPPRFHSHLDAHARAALHRSGLDLPTVQTHVHHERDLYWWTQHAASYCISLYPQVVNGSPRVVSDLLADAAIRPASPIEAPTPDPTTSAPSPSEFGESPFDLLDLQLSPTQMTRFGQCSFRWFAQYGLNLKDLEEPSSTLAPHVRGRLYHHTLDFVAKGLKDHPEASLDSLLTEGFAAAETHENLMRLPNWIWQRAEHLKHLLDLVQAPEFLPEGHVVHVSEQDFTVDWFGLTVKGTLDRLDQTADGFVVTDYKTGSDKPKGACGSDGQLSLDVQLPIYLSAASHLTTTQVTRGRYLSMTKRERRTLADANPDLAGLEALAASFVRSIETGHFPVAPDERQEACQYCSYGPLCRYSFDGGEEHDE